MSSNPSEVRITREIKNEIWRKLDVCQENGALVPLARSSRERFYVPGFYDPQVDPSLLSLRVYFENLFSPIQPELHYRHPHVKHFWIGLTLNYRRVRAQVKVHYDYSPNIRRQEPELRAISCLMTIDGFGFTYLGDYDVWQRLWVPKNCRIAFIDR